VSSFIIKCAHSPTPFYIVVKSFIAGRQRNAAPVTVLEAEIGALQRRAARPADMLRNYQRRPTGAFTRQPLW